MASKIKKQKLENKKTIVLEKILHITENILIIKTSPFFMNNSAH